MTLDRTEIVVLIAGVATIALVLWFFFGSKRDDR